MSDSNCPGINSDKAGLSPGCAGCPNASYCSQPKQPDDTNIVVSKNLSNIQLRIAIMSGKGGVGKSTLTYSIAKHLSLIKSVCMVDLDLTGPSIPKITGTEFNALISNNIIYPINISETLKTISYYNINNNINTNVYSNNINNNTNIDIDNKVNSIIHNNSNITNVSNGIVIGSYDKVYILKMIMSNTLFDCNTIVFDMGPNVSDEHLFLVNYVKNLNVILVTTAQKISLDDVRRQIDFCKKANLNILGLVCNMDGFICECGHKEYFYKGDVKQFCKEENIEYIGSIQYRKDIAKYADQGLFIDDEIYGKITEKILENVILYDNNLYKH